MSQQEFHTTVMLEEEFRKRIIKPSFPIADSRFVYRNAAQTNVQETWKRFGWQPKAQPTIKEITQAALKILDEKLQNANQR